MGTLLQDAFSESCWPFSLASSVRAEITASRHVNLGWDESGSGNDPGFPEGSDITCCCIWGVKLSGFSRGFWEKIDSSYWLMGINSADLRCSSRGGRHTRKGLNPVWSGREVGDGISERGPGLQLRRLRSRWLSTSGRGC